MKAIVITGSTRGIGFGLADSFLKAGCAVTISSSQPDAVDRAVASLVSSYEAGRILGLSCDVRDPTQIETLWGAAQKQFGGVDIWINNAGSGHNLLPSWELSPAEQEKVIDVNLLGAIYGSRVAMHGMIEQGSGQIFNLGGFGSNGQTRYGLSLYGTTKTAVSYFTRSLAMEAKTTPVLVGELMPGMVITDLITNRYKNDPEGLAKVKPIFNIVADSVENVAPFLVKKMLANRKSGVVIRYASPAKYLLRFLSAPFKKRDLFKDKPEG
jgi:NAD(P)-dependent dehydrogenase (short-subunit alcohol dehydrogenase family)